MRVNLVRCFAVLLGLATSTQAFAQHGQAVQDSYVPPPKWNNFHGIPAAETPRPLATVPAATRPVKPAAVFPTTSTPARPLANYAEYAPTAPSRSAELAKPKTIASTTYRHVQPAGAYGHAEQLPAPTGHHAPAPHPQPVPHPAPIEDGYTVLGPEHEAQAPSVFREALSAPWDDCGSSCGTACSVPSAPVRLPLFPWYGGAGLLLWTMEDNDYRRFVSRDGMPNNVQLSSADVDPGYATGFDVFVGRYLDCGRYGLSVGYMNFNPDAESAMVVEGAANHYAMMPQWDQLSIDHDSDTTVDTVYDIYDDAQAHRIRRDVSFQGIELTLSNFGIMGARRLAPACGTGLNCCGPLAGIKRRLGLGHHRGFTTAGGPLERSCYGTPQVITSHGFRWFQFEDEFEFASSDLNNGYTGPTDMFYNSRVTNDLFGYQFGSRLIYCLGPRLNVNVGGKAGIYGNDVMVEQRLGTPGALAYTAANEMINHRTRDVVLAGLGEIDLGLGYRLCNGWSLNGGYRMLYATGVATSIGSIPNDYFSSATSARVYADDNLLLHGAYLGTTLNW